MSLHSRKCVSTHISVDIVLWSGMLMLHCTRTVIIFGSTWKTPVQEAGAGTGYTTNAGGSL